MGEIADIAGQLQLTPATTTKDNTSERASYSLDRTYNVQTTVSFGTGPGQANKQIQDEITVVNGAPVSLDLEDGTELDSFGGQFDANNIKAIMIHHKSTSPASQIDLSGNFLTANSLGTQSLLPGETYFLDKFQLGVPCAAGTSDVITFTNPDAAEDADIEYLFYGDDL